MFYKMASLVPSCDLEGLSACECPVCFNIFSELTQPMALPCGHSLCSVCVGQLTATSKSFRCPLCREWVNHEAVSVNHTLKNLISQLCSVVVTPGGQPHGSSLHVDFSKITIGASLDRGAFGEVFRGSWNGNDVAVKMFSAGVLTPEAMKAFQREVYVMNSLRHPNVVLLMGACQTPPRLAILMEYVAGGSLHKLLHVDKVTLDLGSTCSLASDICRGLQYLHSINILHRDLKSKNVLLTSSPPNGSAKLCDFGLARMRLESTTLTGNVGTVHWSAPEVLSSLRYQFPADLYSLGMVLYEMATNSVPFAELVPVAVMMAVAINKTKPAIPDSVDRRMKDLISSCISWEPSERPPVGVVLTSLAAIAPPVDRTLEQGSGQLSHLSSLGVVFVSVNEGSVVGEQSLRGVARSLGLLEQPNSDGRDGVSMEDKSVSLPMPSATQNPVMSEGGPSDAHHDFPPTTNSRAQTTPSSRKAPPPIILQQEVTKAPPIAPPTPCLAHRSKQPVDSTNPSQQTLVSRHHVLYHVRAIGDQVARKLRQVDTVEKRAFKIGHVVGGHERSELTVQSLVGSFNRKQLRHVPLVEPPPAFPLGRVLPPRCNLVVKRLTSTKDVVSSDNSTLVRSSSTGTALDPHLRLEIEEFHNDWLEQVRTVVRDSLPSVDDILNEKAFEVDKLERAQSVDLDSRVKVHPRITRVGVVSTGSVDLSDPSTSLCSAIVQKGLFDAVKRGRLAGVKDYYDRGASLTASDKSSWTPLHHAARLGKQHVVQFIVNNVPKEALNSLEKEKSQTALHKAAWFGNVDICKTLVEAGASLAHKDYQGSTPYDRAVQSEDLELLDYLRKKLERRSKT